MKRSRRRAVPRLLATGVLVITSLGIAGCSDSDDDNDGRRATVTLSAAPASIVLGQSTVLTWTSDAGTACTASGAWTGARDASGTETVTPTAAGNIAYTLACSGGEFPREGMATATVAVEAASAFSATKLIADTAGTGAITTDARIGNAWGIAFGPTSPLWVANNLSATSTVYDGNGKPQPLATPLVVQLPDPAAGVAFAPTGIVANGTTDFTVSSGGDSGTALFIFNGESGAIAGWSPAVDPGQAIVVYMDDGGAKYTGLAIASNGTANFLYAADFRNGKVDVFDGTYARQAPTATQFAFEDPALPEGYAPFGIQAIPNGPEGSTLIYVSYAKQAPPDNDDELPGAGLGIVNVFDADGVFVERLIDDGGLLNAPWGMALAPEEFGTLGGTLLVGNFGDGQIHGYDPGTGALVGTVVDDAGEPLAVAGLWGIAFGNDAHNQPASTLFYAAGTNDEVNGEIGRIDLGATPPVLNEPPVVTVTAPTGTVSGTTNVTATATSPTNIARVEFFADGDSLGTVTTAPYSVEWDTTAVPDGTVDLTATATDTSGNVGTSPIVTVTVSNAVATVTLSQLQTDVFTPRCSGCHDGSNAPGGALPGSMDLRAGQSWGSLVNVASLEKPALMRVEPGDPANSYLIHKLEGAPDIGGSRMPLGGPFLDQATIDDVRAWIAAGANDD